MKNFHNSSSSKSEHITLLTERWWLALDKAVVGFHGSQRPTHMVQLCLAPQSHASSSLLSTGLAQARLHTLHPAPLLQPLPMWLRACLVPLHKILSEAYHFMVLQPFYHIKIGILPLFPLKRKISCIIGISDMALLSQSLQ